MFRAKVNGVVVQFVPVHAVSLSAAPFFDGALRNGRAR